MSAKACLASRQRVARDRAPSVGLHFLDERRVIGDASDDGDVFEVLGRGADHRRAADVDVLDEVAEGDAGLRGGLLKGVEVDDHHIDGLDAVRGDGSFVLGVAADVEQAAMDTGDGGSSHAHRAFRGSQ